MPRDRQHLPVPLGSTAPAHHRSHRRWPWKQKLVTAAIDAAGAALLMLAAWLTLSPVTPQMFLAADGVHVNGIVLPASTGGRGVRIFAGSATFVMRDARDERVAAAAAATFDGERTTGRCSEQAAVERCTFQIGDLRVSAVDRFDAQMHEWHRTYSDGRTTTIAVPVGTEPVPVALPLGWG